MQNNGNYNWYSTNSLKRFQRSVVRNPPTQYSDEGRYPLGSVNDEENQKMLKLIQESVKKETLELWAGYQKEMREKCVMYNYENDVLPPEVEAKFRTFPAKIQNFANFEIDDAPAADDASQSGKHEFNRNKYVLNRKIDKITINNAESSSSTTETDQIFIDVPDSTPSTTRWVVSGTSPKLQKTSSQTVTLTIPSESTSTPPECILNKYGHCFVPSICPFAHNGVVGGTKRRKIAPTAPVWQRKLPSTQICPGFLNFECWDFGCKNRHILYPSDSVC